MKAFLVLILSATLLMGNSPAEAGILSAVRWALGVLNPTPGVDCEPYQNRLTASNGKQYCCGSEIFNVTSDGECCAGEVANSDGMETCCEPYQNRLTASNGNQYCCGSEIFNVTSDGECCAGEIAYRTFEPYEICCDGGTHPAATRTINGAGADQRCCPEDKPYGAINGCCKLEGQYEEDGEVLCCPEGYIWIDE